MVTLAVSWAAWSVSIVVLVLDVPVVIDVLIRAGKPESIVVPLLAIVALLGLLAYMGIRRSLLSRILYLALGGVLASVYAFSLLVADPVLGESGSYVLNRPAFILVLVAPGILRPVVGIMWSLLGYVVAMASLIAADLIAGAEIGPGWGPTISLGIYLSAYLILAGIRANQANQIGDLRKLEDETRRMALEHQYEQRAAALIHDTVLNDLTVVMNSSGELDQRSRDRLRADVATLSDGAWLRESRDAFELDPTDAALRNGMVALVSDLQWQGLTVDVTGNPETEVVRLSAEKIAVIHAAVRACLENVLQHAQTGSAELVLGASADSVTVMVIDQGVGFDPDAVAIDRLGLRQSITGRVERFGGSVKIWSSPGSGTSVMITMPAEVIV